MINIRGRVYNRENYRSRRTPAIRIDNYSGCPGDFENKIYEIYESQKKTMKSMNISEQSEATYSAQGRERARHE